MNMHTTLVPINDLSEKSELGAKQAHMLERAMELLVENYRVTERHLAVDGQKDAALKVAVKLREADELRVAVADAFSIHLIREGV